MDGFVIHMVQDEFIYIYIFFFSTNSYAFSLRISDMYMARNYNYPTAVFFSFVYRFLQDVNKVVDYCIIIIIIIKTAFYVPFPICSILQVY